MLTIDDLPRIQGAFRSRAALPAAFLGVGATAVLFVARPDALPFAQARAEQRAPAYLLTDLGALPGDPEAGAAALNDKGDVVGWSGLTGKRQRAFVWRGGKRRRLPTPEGYNSGASAVGERGDVVGWFGKNGQSDSRAFLWRDGAAGGQLWELGTLPGRDGAEALGVDGRGVAVGLAYRGEAGERREVRAIRWRGGGIEDLGALPGNPGSAAYAVAGGATVGVSLAGDREIPVVFPKRDGGAGGAEPRPLEPLTGEGRAAALAVSTRGDAAGYSLADGKEHACLWPAGASKPVELGALRGGGASRALGVNRNRLAVGWAEVGSGPAPRPRHAFLYSGGRMYDLNESVPAGSGLVLTEACGINDRGQIVGSGVKDGRNRAFLLTPAETRR